MEPLGWAAVAGSMAGAAAAAAGLQQWDAQRTGHHRGEPLLMRNESFRPAAHDPIVRHCGQAVSTRDLHYVAYYVRGSCVFSLDFLDDPALGRFSEVLTSEERRGHYARQGARLPQMVARLDATLHQLDSGSLIRVVIDVERGALYYFLVHQQFGRYLVGVTLDQDMVHVADAKLSVLVHQVRHHIGHPSRVEPE